MSTVQLSNVTVERDADGLATLQIEVAPETVRTTRDRVIKDYARRIRVPGFRPGHIPPNIVRRNVGDEVIAQSVSDELVPAAYQQALIQSELQPLERAEVEQLTFDAFTSDQPLQFTARVIVRPEMEMGELKGLSITRPQAEVTEEDIDSGLEALRAERTVLRPVEGRGAQEGDIVTADLQVYLDDQPRTAEPTHLRAFMLGESGFEPRVDEHLIDAGLDEERRFNVTYPADFKDEELAGQIAEFAVTLTSIKERVVPELNDEFAQAMGADDVAGLRERMRQFMAERRESEAREAMRTQITQAAAEATQFEVPAGLIEKRLQQRVQHLEQELAHSQATLERYLADTGQSREESTPRSRDGVAPGPRPR
jgi:trigger factor